MAVTRSGLRILIAAIVVVASSRAPTGEGVKLYFPMTSIELHLPTTEKSQSIFSKIPIGRFQVLSAQNNSVAPDYVYSLEEQDYNFLEINNSSGELYIGKDFARLNTTKKFTINAQAKHPATFSTKVPHMTLQLVPQSNEEFCANPRNLCFWPAVHYTVMEHNEDELFRPIRVGSLHARGVKYLCPHSDIIYKLRENKYLRIKDNVLYTRSAIDHEKLNASEASSLTALVSCTVALDANNTQEFTKSIRINVLDRNDNGPVLQDEKEYNFILEDPLFRANDTIGEKIIFIDKDTVETNAHLTYRVHNDSHDLVKPLCNAYETDHTGKRNSMISCQIIFARNGILNVSPYCFSLEASDRAADGLHFFQAEAQICILTDFTKIHDADRPKALPLRGARQNRKSSHIVDTEETMLSAKDSVYGRILPEVLSTFYPRDVYVHRTAAMYSRVTQPEPFLELLRTPTLRFGIAEDRSGAFGITGTAGIVYVKSISALQSSAETVYFLNITIYDTNARSLVVNIHLVDGRPANTSCDHKEKSRSQTCAQIKYRKQCQRFCGLATNGGACEWRGSTSGFFGRNYASCVPNATYCPDNVCDPLEELSPFVCPQDCAASSKIVGPHSVNDNKRGILSASGTCICEDNGKCSCAPLSEEEPRPKRKRKNDNTSTKSEQGAKKLESLQTIDGQQRQQQQQSTDVQLDGSTCGTSCLIIAVTCPMVFVVLLLTLIVSRRNLLRKTKKKRALALHKEGGPVVSDDCDVRKGDLLLMSLENGFKFDSIDSKWEISRECLVLDMVLGEGEFGKVMKAYATNICGQIGTTTVAVKMLKMGANSVEYMALVSEFKLLQEVSHPNVIKLLGACTQGDSPMIVIEYARHGSLRSYLRLNRKIECAGVDFTDGVEPVTARDILSFAWQICKGMTYLTEIKLVHRDLAARNVLLAEGKICKISDFGLTRDVYEDDAYLKRSRDRVPVKWMAPESLADHVYTTKSDVWAFGVLCWELITLGASPYPGISPQNLYHLLKTGYRMERPENCSEDIYSIIRTCWTEEPNARPSFKYLAAEFEKLLGTNVKYIELASNAVSNPLYCTPEVKVSQSFPPSDTHFINGHTQQLSQDVDTTECVDHLWCPPKTSCDLHYGPNSGDLSITLSPQFHPPPGYDMPRPLIEASTTEQMLRYENDLRFPLCTRKSTYFSALEHYSVPSVKRGRSYIDMSNDALTSGSLDGSDFEKRISKHISFRFSSLFNMNEQDDSGL